jgi:hypothetical protein
VGDNAFHNPMAKEWLAQHREIARVALPRRTARPAWPAPLHQQVNNIRRTIESALRVLCTVFHLERPGARSLAGLLSRITTQLFADPLSFVVWAFLPTPEN